MAEKRGYKVTRKMFTGANEEVKHVVAHTPADVLKSEGVALAKGEKAKRNHWYHSEDGGSVLYVPVSLQQAREQKVVERNIANNATINLRLEVNDDSHLTGETVTDDAIIEALGVPQFFGKLDYEMLCKLANAQGITVSVPADSMYRFNTAYGIYADLDAELADIEKGVSAIEARVSGAPQVAAFKAPEPSRNSQRGKSGNPTYGLVSKLREDMARLQHENDRKDALIRNAAIRERELRAQLINGAIYVG